MKIILLFLGIFLTTVGITYIICYTNLLSLGYNFIEYVKFIYSRPECVITIIGIAFILFATTQKGE